MPDQPPRDIPGVIAYLQLSDAKAAAELYKKAFAAKEIDRKPVPDGRLMHCHLEINNGALMLADHFPEYGQEQKPVQGVVLHIASSTPRVWWQRAVDAGLEITLPLEVAPWGDLYGQLRDPFGVTWGFVGPAS
jgi:PhnB protein